MQHSTTAIAFYMGLISFRAAESNHTCAITLVNVPVLSEQMTETAPNVSTVLSDLHNIMFLRIKFAVIVKLAVKAIGSPSGMKAMATLTQSTMRVGTLIQSG